jgi:hypothetical protein
VGNFDLQFPWDKGFGTPASSSMWRKMAQLWSADGVVAGYLQSLNATIAGTTVTVNPGACFMHGYYGEIQTAQTITGVGSSGTILARADLVNENCSIYYNAAVTDYGAGGFQQDANAWEIPLWLVNAGALVDLRTLLSPGAAHTWWNTQAGPNTINSGQAVQYNFVSARVPYTGHALLIGTLVLTFSDASQAQTATCQLTYQYGAADQALSPTVTRSIPGTGPAGSPVERDVSLTGMIPVASLGKKNVGWRVTAGSGTQQIKVASLTASMMLTGFPPAA